METANTFIISLFSLYLHILSVLYLNSALAHVTFKIGVVVLVFSLWMKAPVARIKVQGIFFSTDPSAATDPPMGNPPLSN